MTRTTDNGHSGEARLRRRRRRFLSWMALATIGFAVLGAVSGYLYAASEGGAAPPWIVFPLALAAIVGLIVFTLAYFRRVDEVDRQDNLWASLVGLYFYLAALPTWEILHRAGYLPEPDQWALWVSTFVISSAAYLARRLGLR